MGDCLYIVQTRVRTCGNLIWKMLEPTLNENAAFCFVYRNVLQVARKNQDHTIGSFQAELDRLDEDLDKEEIKITQETIQTLTALRNAH